MFIEFIREWGINSVWVIAFGMLLIEIRHWYNSKQRDEKFDAVKKELAEISSRGNAPYLVAVGLRLVTPEDDVKYLSAIQSGIKKGSVKSDYQGTVKLKVTCTDVVIRYFELDLPPGYALAGPKKTRLTPGEEFIISYANDRNHYNTKIPFKIKFEIVGGFKGEHLYELNHGIAEVKRIDPK